MKIVFKKVYVGSPETGEVELNWHCVVFYKKRARIYINTTQKDCLLDFLEDIIPEKLEIVK